MAFASRTMSETERRYAQIEKEALSLTWACERFRQYVLGLTFELVSDNKPLVALLTSTRMSDVPPRILRFRVKLSRFQFTLKYCPGTDDTLSAADALSRAAMETPGVMTEEEIEDIEENVACVVETLNISDSRLQEVKDATAADPTFQKLMRWTFEGWPRKVPGEVKRCKPFAAEFSVENGILLRGEQIAIPVVLRREYLDLHCMRAIKEL